MQLKTFGKIIIGISIAGVAITLLIDISGFGKSGLKSTQLLGLQVFTLLFFVGLGLCRQGDEGQGLLLSYLKDLLQKIGNLPSFVWVGLGFLIVYLWIFVPSMFFDPLQRFDYFTDYLLLEHPIGKDFRAVSASLRRWLIEGNQPTVLYPPLFNLLFAPFLLLEYPLNFFVLTFLSIASYFILFFFLPLLTLKKNDRPLISLILVATLVSYGVQFELERGQFHSIAFMLSMLAVYLFHYHRHFRWLAYLLFTFSMQIKVYPVIFIFLLIENWRDWKNNLKRFLALGIFNFLLLFVLGGAFFNHFFNHMVEVSRPTQLIKENHSISAFITQIGISGFDLFPPNEFVRENASIFITALSIYFLLCLFLVIRVAYVNNRPGIDKGVLFVSALGSLLLPTINHDYTLPILAFPFLMMMAGETPYRHIGKNWLRIALLLISAIAYFLLLFPCKYRPGILINSMPGLIVLLTTATLLILLDASQERIKDIQTSHQPSPWVE
ncbi:MAG: glycosyltransferase family 87 protein [Chloroflexota bacterium]